MIKQDTQEWKELRKNYLGASDAPVIMGVSPWKTKYQLWQEKLGLVSSESDNSSTRYGKEMENPARQHYELLTGNIVTPKVVFHPEVSFMMASLDGLTDAGDISVEIKNPSFQDHSEALLGKVPLKYYPQVQHQLACLGHQKMHYFSFYKGEGALVEVLRDEEYIHKLYEQEKTFWNKVLSLEEPELSDQDYVEIDDLEWEYLADRWKLVHNQLQALENQEQELRDALIQRANNQSAKGGGIKLTKFTRRGFIDYKSIPELADVNLEQYRKKPVESWKVSDY